MLCSMGRIASCHKESFDKPGLAVRIGLDLVVFLFFEEWQIRFQTVQDSLRWWGFA